MSEPAELWAHMRVLDKEMPEDMLTVIVDNVAAEVATFVPTLSTDTGADLPEVERYLMVKMEGRLAIVDPEGHSAFKACRANFVVPVLAVPSVINTMAKAVIFTLSMGLHEQHHVYQVESVDYEG